MAAEIRTAVVMAREIYDLHQELHEGVEFRNCTYPTCISARKVMNEG